MVAKWKGKKLKHSIILQKLNDLKNINEDGTISWKGFEYFSATLALQSMIKFPEKVNDFYKGSIVKQALDNILKNHLTLHEKEFMNEINSIIHEASKTKFKQFYVLSSLSLGGQNLIKDLDVENCKISFFSDNYPDKFKNRETFIDDQYREADKTPLEYTKIVISVEAKSEVIAITTALRALDLQRAVWCLFNNNLMEIPDNEWEPINKIRSGHIHTVHDKNGQCVTELLWYEPNFTKAKLFIPSDPKKFSQNSEWSLSQLSKLSYSNTMKTALLRYVRALDEVDQNVAVIKLWGALEELTTDSNYDLVTRRISFLFKEPEYHP